MLKTDLNSLPKETLIKLIEMPGKNWVSVDGFWCMGVEDEFRSEAALKLDVNLWEKQGNLEGRRLKKVLELEGSMEDVLRALDFAIEEDPPPERFLIYRGCPVQEARIRLGRGEFVCKEPAHLYHANMAAPVDPRAKARCVSAPPNEHPSDIRCYWEVIIDNP